MINAIFAVDFNGGMGFNGSLPWPHNAEDLQYFKDLTTGHVVVCGRKTWDDPKMPKPLPNRTVYVATHRPVSHANPFSGDIQTKLLDIESAHPDKKIFVIGGPDLIESAKPLLDRIYLTHIKGSYKVDTRIYVKEFLAGFTPVRATVSKDFNSTFTVYDPIFKRSKTST
ncbi:FolA Dihydrofolate reductase [uncultured Caudovirales phage]|uniref:dihydrofolate reductase n=1 Tax=uncultured Caudovirales phage TaxID=2100421 RepID=A0A6J5L6E5_9CAUD|nr:FolA Dihydrofolate reductase [uncultured Caudovirales phage]